MKKVVRIVILSVFAFCLSIACKNYTEDIEDYLSYWSAGVSITEYRFEPQPQIYTEGMQYVPSKAAVTVTFTVHNSKNLNLKMPGDSDAPADIISFPHIPDAHDKSAAAPQSGKDYKFEKISNTELKLTYNPAFLQKYEWGRGDITPSIILYTTDGRVFKQNIPFKLKVNTPPPAIAECVVGQTKTDSPSETSYYVLCLQLPADKMEEPCGNGLLHEDIAGIEINGTIYNLSVDRKLKQLKAQADSPFIGKDKVTKLAPPDAENIPSDWTLYFKTDVKVMLGSAKKDYTIRLKDEKGLSSKSVTVGTQGKIITVTFNLAGGNISGSTTDITMTGVPGTPLTQPTNPTKGGYTFNGWNPLLPSPLEFPAADTTYTAQWQEIPKPGMRIKEGISAEEKSYGESGTDDLVPNAEHHTNTTPLIIYKESGQAKLSITGSSGTTAYYRIDAGSETQGTEINLSADGSAHKLTVWAKKGTDDSIKTELYVQVKDALTTYKELKNVVKHANDGVVINIGNNLNCTEESSEIEINKTLTVQRKTTSSAPPRYIINANEKGRFFKVVSGGQLTLKDLTLKNGKMSGSITTGIGGGIRVLSGGTCQLTNCIITECKAVNGGALIVAGRCTLTDSIVENNSFLAGGSAAAANVMAAGTLVLEGNTVIKGNKTAGGTPDAMAVVITGGITLKGAAQVEAGNNIYLSVGTAYITVDGNLAASPTAAGVSMPAFSAGRKVLAGNLTLDNIGKFTLVGFHAEQWKINASGELEAVGGQSQVVNTWEALRTAVQNASDGAVIEVTQDITYGFTSVNSIIEVKKNITIKSKGSNKYTLDANGKGADREQSNDKSTGIFEVSGNKTLTLENLILTKTEKYAIYVAEGDNSLTMKNVTIKDCKTNYNAAGIYFRKGKDLTLENCTIEKCKGTITANLASGGIDIEEPTGTVSLKDTEIKNCEVTGTQSTGGGIHLYKGTCTLTNVIIQECKAPKGGGMCVNAGTLTITGGSFTKNEATGTGTDIQGGAIYSEDGRLTLKSCMIGGNNSGDGNRAKKGGGIYLKNVALTMEGVTVKNNKALTQGAGIYLAAGELKIPGGNTIADNSIIDNGNSEAGGGIYVEKGMLTLDGGSIDGNSANANKGGGVHLKAGTFTMNSGEIKNCSAKYGGGVSLAGKSSFTMTGGSITGCKAKAEGGEGGGIYTTLKTQLTLEGTNSNPVVISNCTAEKAGGGMLIYTNNPVTVKNARIEGNTAGNGGGVYLEQGTFTIAGSTRITPSTEATAGKNDVFLKGEKFITISDSLTAETPIARITPENYTAGVRVLQAPSTECAKFTVTPNSEGSWSIKSDGTLKKQ